MARFSDVFFNATKEGCKIPKEKYLPQGLYPIIDQGQGDIAGYTNNSDGLYKEVPAVIFGDHTRIIKYVDTPFFLGADGVKLLKAKDPAANYKYLFYALCAAKIPDTGYNRHFKWLKELDIPLPSPDEQRRIVSILDKVTSLIDLRKQQLAKLDELVKARFVEMFGEPVTNPMGWPVHRLSEYIIFLTSGSRGWSKYFTDAGEIFITIKNVKDCKINLNDVQYVTPPQNAEAKRTKVQEGDLLISITADLGRTGVVSKEIAKCGGYINQHLTCIRLQKEILHPLYIAYYMESEAGKRQFHRKNQAGVKAGLNFDSIKSLTIALPPIEVQNSFVSYVSQIDRQMLTIRQGLDILKMLQKSMMQDYFESRGDGK